MTASIRDAAARLLLSQHLSSFYACGVMDLRRFEGEFLIDTYLSFGARGAVRLPSLPGGALPHGMTLPLSALPIRALILYDETLPPPRRNFTIAHEIGHVMLGHTELSRRGLNAGQRRQMERSSDEFAAALLMPPVLIGAWEQMTGGVMEAEEIGRCFAVSRQAAVRQRRELNAMKRQGISYSPAERALAKTLFAPLLAEKRGR